MDDDDDVSYGKVATPVNRRNGKVKVKFDVIAEVKEYLKPDYIKCDIKGQTDEDYTNDHCSTCTYRDWQLPGPKLVLSFGMSGMSSKGMRRYTL